MTVKISEIISLLEAGGTWVDWSQTRDYLLHGSGAGEVDAVGVCWVATMPVIREAVQRLAIGTGAATDLFQMLPHSPDAVVAADDGILTFYQGQFAVDQDLPMVIVNHACCETCGIRSMADYLRERFPGLSVSYLDHGMEFHYYPSGNG